jgi:MazG family protein
VNFVRKNFYPGHGKHKVDEKETPALTPIENLKTVMARLRHPEEGCPWDREQTFASVAPYTIEEAYEVSEAIDSKDMSSLKEELGDLLLQIVFHSRMAEESGDFNFDDVAQTISDKMISRHPHVFGKEPERSKEFHSG